MSEDCVVVMRTRSGDEILAILNGEENGVIKAEHPYYVRYGMGQQQIAMIPYCHLSDEKYFEFRRADLQFLVTANKDIASKFLKMVNAHEKLLDLWDEEPPQENDDPWEDLLSEYTSKVKH